jgi:hypothetical protein
VSELPIKTTLKAGTGYDAPWLTVDANDPGDLEFKLKALIESPALGLVVEAANALKAANNAAPLLGGNTVGGHDNNVVPLQAAPPHAQSSLAQNGGWGQQAPLASGSSFGGGDRGMNPEPPRQQNQQPQQQGFTRPATLHPEGKTCESCNAPLEYKKTSSGKGTWRCPDWRWNSGNPNGHTQLWA